MNEEIKSKQNHSRLMNGKEHDHESTLVIRWKDVNEGMKKKAS